MSRTREFIEGLHDVELAFLYKYKYHTYLEESQAIITQEIDKRGLTQEQMDSYVAKYENKPENVGCPRCNSMLHVSQRVEFYNTSRSQAMNAISGNARREGVYTSVDECAVCGYKLFDGNDPSAGFSFFSLLKRLFRK